MAISVQAFFHSHNPTTVAVVTALRPLHLRNGCVLLPTQQQWFSVKHRHNVDGKAKEEEKGLDLASVDMSH